VGFFFATFDVISAVADLIEPAVERAAPAVLHAVQHLVESLVGPHAAVGVCEAWSLPKFAY